MTVKIAGGLDPFKYTTKPKHVELIVTPLVEAYFDQHDGIVLSEVGAQAVVGLLSTPPRDRSGSFAGSARGKCLRAQVFQFLGMPGVYDRPDPVLQNIFLDGTWRHIRWQVLLLRAAEIARKRVAIEVPCRAKQWRLRGSADAIVENVLVELKGTRQFRMAMEAPFIAHVLQVHSYLVMRPDLEYASIVYEEKSTQEWKEFIVPRQERYINAVEAELDTLNEAVDQRKLPGIRKGCQGPPDETKGKSQEWWECPYRLSCHGCDYDTAESAGL